MKKAIVLQPIQGKSEKEIADTKERAVVDLEGVGYYVINTVYEEDWYNYLIPWTYNPPNKLLYYLAYVIQKMSFCDCVCFCEGWADDRVCELAYYVAVSSGLEIVYA